ncbi:MAG: sterol desaturase family protein [Bacteroidia bacterium]
MKQSIPTPTKSSERAGEGTRLFRNRWIEAFTRTHISIPLILFYGGALGLILYTVFYTPISGFAIAGLFWLGMFVFTFIEYAMHRWLFHLVTDTAARTRFQYVVHGVHHKYPRDRERLVMPPFVSLAISITLVGIFQMVMGIYSYSFVAGIISGYASYLVIHYSVHIFKPPRNFLRRLWTHHAVHHYRDDGVAYGVSSPLWDFIFHTLPRDSKKVRSQVEHS